MLSGGGTLGPVTPLLGLAEIIHSKNPDTEFVWVGTKNGPEKKIVEEYNVRFIAVTSGKMRRYFSFLNILDWFKIKVAFWQSLFLLLKEKPDVLISAGGYVSVPLHFAAWFHSVPTWIHQQDVRVGLANKLMAPFAKVVTTALEQNVKKFKKSKTLWLGNPVRSDVYKGSKEKAQEIFNLKKNLPVVFATGGGTGSNKINQLIVEASQHLKNHAQIIHLTGKERSGEYAKRVEGIIEDYQAHEFFTKEMKHAYAVADVVISRGGFGTITELSALGKASILIPMPGHQEENVEFLNKAGAVIVMKQDLTDSYKLAKMIQDLLENKNKREEMGEKLKQILPIAKEEIVVKILNRVVK